MPEQDSTHFIGIGGIGMSALAQMSLARGARVTGSDAVTEPAENPVLARLGRQGARIYTGHAAANLEEGTTLVVASAAISPENPELVAAVQRGLPVVSRAELLGRLMRAHRGLRIAVAGTHGKTTTTAMLAVLLQHAGLDPTVFVGGEVPALGGNLRIGSEEGPFVAEACEAYDSFLTLRPDIAILTNIEADHLDHYADFAHVLRSFGQFLEGVPERAGQVVACLDDPGVRKLLDARSGRNRVVGYGLEAADAESTAVATAPDGKAGARDASVSHFGTRFIWRYSRCEVSICLGVPGLHNVQNALAAATAASLIGVGSAAIAAGLSAFTGTVRRMERLGEVELPRGGRAVVLDDYAHHPTEIRATLSALRTAFPERRQVAVFQPHLYSRTRDFLDEFALSLASVDLLLVTEIYAAREAPLPGVSARQIVERAREGNPEMAAHFIPHQADVPAELGRLVRPADAVIFLGAGDIRRQAELFVSQYPARVAANAGAGAADE